MLFYGVPQSQSNDRRAIHTMMFRAFILAGLLLCSFMFGAYMDVFANTEAEESEQHVVATYDFVIEESLQQEVLSSVDVQQGDTLWSIAQTHLPSKSNIRVYIEKIKLLNDLDDHSIYVGQLLYLP